MDAVLFRHDHRRRRGDQILTRYNIVCKCVERWCRFFELPPWFWRTNLGGRQLRSRVVRNLEGTEEDRSECLAMIVGTLKVKAFQMHELIDYLHLGSGTISIYWDHYKAIPNETRQMLLSLDGQLAPEFYRSIVVDAQADRIKRLEQDRARYTRQHGKD